jgi:cobalamin biosynthesis protein CobT
MPINPTPLDSLALFQRAELLVRRLEESPQLGNIIGNDSRSSEDSESSEASETSEDSENSEGKEAKDGSDDTERSEDSENSEGSETSEDSEDSENSESSEDSETSEGKLFTVIESPFSVDLPVDIVAADPRRMEELLVRVERLKSNLL